MTTRAADLQAFTGTIPAELERLAHALRDHHPEALPLDHSYASLDRLEACFGSLTESAALELPLELYIGETLIARAGGRWDLPRTKADLGMRCVTQLPLIERARFYPRNLVLAARRARVAGRLRERTERHDIPLRRAELSQLLADRTGVLAELHRDVATVLGRDPGTLDESPSALDTVEDALKQIDEVAEPERWRRVARAAIVYLGGIVERSVGGTWAVCVEPRDADLGQFAIAGWAPLPVISNVGPESPPHIFRNTLELVIKGRK